MKEQLIEAVRPHKILFDKSHADYTKQKLKNNTWEKIADDLELKNCKYLFLKLNHIMQSDIK